MDISELIILILFPVVFSFIEGLREYKIFRLNKEAGYDSVPYWTQPKIENALLFGLSMFFYGGIVYLIFSSLIRFVVLNVTLNSQRENIGVFHVGFTAKTDLAIRYISRKTRIPSEILMMVVYILCMGLSITILMKYYAGIF